MHYSSWMAYTSLFLFLSCKHEPEIEEKLIPTATIQFTSPAPGSVFRNGDIITIAATAISTAPIHGFDLSIHKTSDKRVYYFNHIHDHNDTIQVREQWQNFITGPEDLEAEITLYLDHDGHLFQRKAVFKTE